MPGQLHPRGVRMRDYSTGRAGFDRVLMAVAATFLAVAANSAFAQDHARSPADLAIDAAVPLPEPANVPPPTVNDFKPDTTASVPDPVKTTEKSVETPATETATAPAGDSKKNQPAIEPAAATAAPAAEPAKEPVKAASNVAPADQPVADKLRELLGAKSSKYFDRKAERGAVEKFYIAREYAPVWTEGGLLSAAAKGVIARLKDAAADGLDA